MSASHKVEENISVVGSRNVLTADGVTFTKRSSRTSKMVMVLLFIMSLLVVALVAVSVTLVLREKSRKDESSTDSKVIESKEVCNTVSCVMAASAVINNMDASVDPCEDFDKFACGGFRENLIPDNVRIISSFGPLKEQLIKTMKELLESPIEDSDEDYVQQAKIYYHSCLNIAAINKLGLQPLKDELKNHFGGWPLTTADWNPESFDRTETMLKLYSRMATYSLVSFGVQGDLINSSLTLMLLDQPTLVLGHRDNYLVPYNDTLLVTYRHVIYEVGSLFGFANSSTEAEDDVIKIVEFEQQLANISLTTEEVNDFENQYTPMTVKEISDKYKNVLDWKRFLKIIANTPGINIGNVTESDVVINYATAYYEKLDGLLNQTEPRTVANYLMWRMILKSGKSQGYELINVLQPLYRALNGISASYPRYTTCIQHTTKYLKYATGNLYVKEKFDPESKNMAQKMVDNIKEAFFHLVDELKWLDDDTKILAKEKGEYIAEYIGYPDMIMNETIMNHLHQDMNFSAGEYMKNDVILHEIEFKMMWNTLPLPNGKESRFSPVEINAYYSFLENSIMFPAAILQPPFYGRDFPKSINYGSIGTVIGHEITHGFDNMGRKYDKNGNAVQWWSDSAIENFENRTQCMIDQYSNYTVESINMKVNGILTLGENIADNGGVKQSFKAYRNWVAKQGKEEPYLPGLEYNNNQLFFISFAQVWCSKMRKQEALYRIFADRHSPNRYRTIGVVQNSEEFSQIFGCSADAKMNPKKKCKVW